MNTRPDEQLPYLILARQGARVVRSVQAEGFTRLAQIAPGRGALQIAMTFSVDQDERPWVVGSAELMVEATCQRCLEQFDRPLRVDFELCIVSDDRLASEVASRGSVLTPGSDMVTIADVVEDELILGLPERLCSEEPCVHAPPLSYPIGETAEPVAEDSPFRVLSVLKQ